MPDSPATPAHGVDPLADDAVVRATFESAPDGLVVVAQDGRILAYNTSFLQLWRFPPDMLARRDALEMRLFTAQQMQDPQAYLDTLPRVAAADHTQVFDALALRDGRVFERHVSPLRLPDGGAAVVIRWRDITERLRAEQALARTQARLSAIFEHALNAILLASDDGHYLDANPAACRLLGYSHDQLVGRAVAEVVVPDRVDTATAWGEFRARGHASGRVRLRNHRPNRA